MMETISPQEFEQQVRDCLAHFYDYGFLREQLLVNLLVPNHTGATQVQVFRQIVTEVIEGLRPDVGAAFHSKQARIYNILMLRYIDQQQPQDVMQHLALSERQFYRDHPRAIQTLGQLLWERITGTPASGDGNPPPGEIQAADVPSVRYGGSTSPNKPGLICGRCSRVQSPQRRVWPISIAFMLP
jgi:hypothetical protein